jgi:thiol-disulfide isomerase/thioredoxin
LKEVPALQQLEKELKNDKVVFVSISIDSTEEPWKKKMEEKNMHGNQLWNPDNSLGQALNVKGIPFFVIYDPEGKLYMHGAPRPSQGLGIVKLLEGLK